MLQVNILIEQMSDSAVFTIHWSSFKHLLMYMHVLDWDDEFFIKWKKLCAELNDYKLLLLWSCFCITTMLNSRTFLSIRNDSWILNDFLMLYCRICKKKLFYHKVIHSCCWLCNEKILCMLSIIDDLSYFLIEHFWICSDVVSSESLFT